MEFVDDFHRLLSRRPTVKRCFRRDLHATQQPPFAVEDVDMARLVIADPPDEQVAAAANLAHDSSATRQGMAGAGLPGFELSGEVFLPSLTQLGHDVGMLCSEPVLKLIQGFDG